MVESSLLERLSAELGYELHVVDVEYRTEVMGRKGHLDVETIEELSRQVEGKFERPPARLAVDVAGARTATAFPLSTHRTCMLVAASPLDVDLDAFVLVHTQSLIGIEVERATRQRESDEVGEALFKQIIDGSLGSDAAQPRLEQAGLAHKEWLVGGFDARHLRSARIVLGDKAIPFLSCSVGEEGYVLAAADDSDAVADLLRSHVPHLGFSARSSALQRLPDSVRQARWALQAARGGRQRGR
jgi:PucR family transcriptional regulator, purine catabolism regulatory protein